MQPITDYDAAYDIYSFLCPGWLCLAIFFSFFHDPFVICSRPCYLFTTPFVSRPRLMTPPAGILYFVFVHPGFTSFSHDAGLPVYCLSFFLTYIPTRTIVVVVVLHIL
ncbi:hypothetical protein B0J17DRAFT_664312 [Rhizoctonia solani]|nr:hypothetical protein B0J17DRAFT_664312 [Rhizoctonia solani]